MARLTDKKRAAALLVARNWRLWQRLPRLASLAFELFPGEYYASMVAMLSVLQHSRLSAPDHSERQG